MGDTTVRPHKNPNLNLQATSPEDLINWDTEKFYIPIFTCKMTLTELKDFRKTPLRVMLSLFILRLVREMYRKFQLFPKLCRVTRGEMGV